MGPHRVSLRPLRVLFVSVSAVALAVYSSVQAFSSLCAGQQHDAAPMAKRRAISRLRGNTIFRRQESSDAPEAALVLKTGDRVQVQYEAAWYNCEILEISADGSTCTARYDEGGDEEPDIDVAARVRPIPPLMPLTRGQRVEVFYAGVWYAAEVMDIGKDGTTCTAKYDDGGDVEPDIDVTSRVRPPRIPLSSLEIGSKHKGTVVSITPFGAFVDIGSEKDGLVHVSLISKERVDDASDFVAVGQEVDVWVSSVGDGKLGLTMIEGVRSKPSNVRKQVDVESFREYSPDQWIPGIVQNYSPFGVFVNVPAPDASFEASGLVHITEIREGFVENPEDEVKIGQEVPVRVTKVENGRISLSMKEVDSKPSRKPSKRGFMDLTPFVDLKYGPWLKGEVTSIPPFGLFVRVSTPDGSLTTDGLVHITNIRNDFIQSTADEAEVGQEVKVWVKDVDVVAGKLSLSMRSDEGPREH